MEQKTILKPGSDFLGNMSASYLEKCHAREKDPKARDRLMACILYKKGLSIRDMGKFLNRCYSTVRSD